MTRILETLGIAAILMGMRTYSGLSHKAPRYPRLYASLRCFFVGHYLGTEAEQCATDHYVDTEVLSETPCHAI